jgi:L-ascorbate metabolism protein UlaG (beta-lactamase superfamily)
VPVVIPLGAARLLRRRGFSNVTEVEEGEHVDVGAVVVRATHAEHSPGRGPIGVRSPALGYVVEGTRSVYFAGDTDRFDGMARLAPSLDVALLPVAGWGARIPAGHLDAVAAAETLTLLRPRIAIPAHWGTFAPFYRGVPHNADAGLRFAEHAQRVAPDVEVRVLRPGESTPI